MPSGGNGGIGNGKPAVLNDKAIDQIKQIKGVMWLLPKNPLSVSFGIGKYVCHNQVIGIDPQVMQKFNYELQDGRLLKPGDKFIAVFGNQIPSMFYNPKSQGYNWNGKPQV